MMVQGSQLKREETTSGVVPKEIARVQSMKPIIEPLMSKQETAKSTYWRANSNMQDDGAATVLLEKQRGINADISVNDTYQQVIGTRNEH